MLLVDDDRGTNDCPKERVDCLHNRVEKHDIGRFNIQWRAVSFTRKPHLSQGTRVIILGVKII